MKRKWKRTLAFMLAAMMFFGSADWSVMQVSATEVEETLEAVGEEIELSPVETSAIAVSLYSSDGASLKEGNATAWIDRIDFSGVEEALDFYESLVEASDNDGESDYLIEDSYYTDSYSKVTIIEVSDILDAGDDAQTALDNTLSEVFYSYYPYIVAARDAFDRDHPEVFWLSGNLITGYTGGATYDNSIKSYVYTATIYAVLKNGSSYDIRSSEYQSESTIKAAIAQADAKVQEYSAAAAGKTDADKIEYFNEQLTKTNEYNTSSDLNNIGHDCRECISALIGSTGTDGPVCEGYARAFKVLCDAEGIPCVLESGNAFNSTSSSGEAHMWNNVQADGNWYGADITWNDPVVSGKSGAVSGYESTKWLLVGSDTVINSMTFAASHPAENTVSTGGAAFTNGPVMSSTAFVRETKISAVDDGIRLAYSGNSVALSTVKGTHFTWNSDGTATIEGYYADSEGAATLNGAPTDAGTYYAKVTVSATGGYPSAAAYIPFTITQAKGKIENTGYETSYTYTGEPIQAPSQSDFTVQDNGEISFVWYQGDYTSSELDETSLISGLPENPGVYTLVASKKESTNYRAAELRLLITIAKGTRSIVISDDYLRTYTYDGKAIAEPTVTEYSVTPDAEVRFVWYTGDETKLLENAPADAGTYTLAAIIAEDGEYAETVEKVLVTIKQAAGSVENKTTGGYLVNGNYTCENLPAEPTKDQFAVTGDGELSYAWYQESVAAENKLAQMPENAGNYVLLVTLGEGKNYKGDTLELEISIGKAKGTVSVADSYQTEYVYGKSIEEPTTEQITKKSSGEVSFAWFDETGTISLENEPASVGSYILRVTAEADHNYTTAVTDVKITISAANGSIAYKDYVTNYTYNGTSISEPKKENFTVTGDGNVTFYWYKGDYTNSSLTGQTALSGAPVDAGIYTLLAVLEAGENYTGAETKVCVKIDKAQVIPSISGYAEKTYDGSVAVENDDLTISLSGVLPDDAENVGAMADFEYASAGAGTSIKVTAKNLALNGTRASNYELSETVAETSGKINPKDLKECTVAINGLPAFFKNEEIKPDVVITDGTNNLKIDTDYTLSYSDNTAVSEDGAKIIITGVGNYTGTRTETFSITYFATPSYTISSDIIGNDNIYGADVVIKADGYLVSDSVDGEYAESYTFSGDGLWDRDIYFKQIDTGYITAGTQIILDIDKTGPVIYSLSTPSEEEETLSDAEAVVHISANETGKCFYAVKKKGESELKSITDFATRENTEWTAKKGIYYAGMTNVITLSALEPETEYVLYVVYVDELGNSSDVMSVEFTTLVAEAERYQITYVLYEDVTDQDTYTEHGKDDLKTPERKGYTFAGWYNGTKSSSKKVTEIKEGTTGDLTLYARWKLNSYSITYNLNGGSFKETVPDSYTVEDKIEFAVPVRYGYSFDGWYTDETCAGTAVTGIEKDTLSEDVSVYAKWKWDVTFKAELSENDLVIPCDKESVKVNLILTAMQNGAAIGMHIPAEDLIIELYKNSYEAENFYKTFQDSYDFIVTREEASEDSYIAVVKFVDAAGNSVALKGIPFKVSLEVPACPINKEITWQGISGLERSFGSIKDDIREELFDNTAIEENFCNGTISFEGIEDETAIAKAGAYTIVYTLGINDTYLETAEAVVKITYSKITSAGVGYEPLYEEEVAEEYRNYESGIIAAPVESGDRTINATAYVSGVKVTPQFNTPWGTLTAAELEAKGYDVKVSAKEVAGLTIQPLVNDDNCMTIVADSTKTATKTVKLTSEITLSEGAESNYSTIVATTIKNFKVVNGAANAMKDIDYTIEGDLIKLDTSDENDVKSYLIKKSAEGKQTITLKVTTTDYEDQKYGYLNDELVSGLKDKLTWKTSSSSIVSVKVDANGMPTLTIPKNAQGVAEITATAKDAGKYSISFRIVVADMDVRVETTSLTMNSKAALGIWVDGKAPTEAEWGEINLYPNVLAMDLLETDVNPTVKAELTDKNGVVLTDSIFELDDSSVVKEGKLKIRFKEIPAAKKNYTIYLKVTQTFSDGTKIEKEKIKVTIKDQWSVPTVTAKASGNYNTALTNGYAEAIVTVSGGTLFNYSDLTLAEGTPFVIDSVEQAGEKPNNQYRVKLVLKEADYKPAENKKKTVKVKFEAACVGYGEKAISKDVVITLTNTAPDFKLSAQEYNNPVFYKKTDYKEMMIYISVPEGMTDAGTEVRLTEAAEKYFEVVSDVRYIEKTSQLCLKVRSKTDSNASIQFLIANENFVDGEVKTKSLKTSGRTLSSESITLYDQNTEEKAAKSFTLNLSYLGKESIRLYAESGYLTHILEDHGDENIAVTVDVQPADKNTAKLLNKQAVVVEKDGVDFCITATKDAFSNKSTNCKFKVSLNVTDGEQVLSTKSQTITVTLNPKAVTGSITLKAGSSLNAAYRDAKVCVTPTVKNMPTGYVIENVKLSNAADAEKFVLSDQENGVFYISPAYGAKIPTGKNVIDMTYDIRTVSGERMTKNTAVTLNVVQTAKIVTNVNSINLYNSAVGESFGKEIVFSESKVQGLFERIEILNEEELKNAGIGIVKDDENAEITKVLKFYVNGSLNRGLEKSYTVKAKVTLYNSGTKKGEPITYTVNIKLNLKK